MDNQGIKQKLISFAAEVFDSSEVLFAYLFGSYATGQFHSFSDLDIAVYTHSSSLRQQMELEMALALEIDSKMGKGPKSDVRSLRTLPLMVAGAVVTKGVLIYCGDNDARIEYETMIRKLYFDFRPVVQKYHQEYLRQG